MTDLVEFLALLILGAPIFALVLLTISRFASDELPEARITQLTSSIFAVGLVGALALAGAFVTFHVPRVVVNIGTILSFRSYHFDLALELTPTTLVLLVLTFLLSALVGS